MVGGSSAITVLVALDASNTLVRLAYNALCASFFWRPSCSSPTITSAEFYPSAKAYLTLPSTLEGKTFVAALNTV